MTVTARLGALLGAVATRGRQSAYSNEADGHTQMPANWQGRSLFADGRHNRVYFCAPWSDFLFGYRDGNKKLIYNATKNTFEVYDLSADPQETNDLAASESAFIRVGRQHMAAWVQYQAKY